LSCYGIKVAKARTATTVEEVEKIAQEMQPPLVVKLVSDTVLHKTDVGGVQLDLKGPAEAVEAAERIRSALEKKGLGAELEGFLVQEMVQGGGAEMFVGVSHDPSFGPLVACGAGGTMVELLRDVSVRVTPLTEEDAEEMVRSLKSYPLFTGYRGGPELDEEAFRDLLLRISALVEDIPHLLELDLNPVLVREEGSGCVVLDARVKVGIPVPPHPRGARTRRDRSPR
jgi:acyl-CoA synthetase (NDP forming)